MPVLDQEFARFEPLIRQLPRSVSDADLARDMFRLEEEGKLEIYYAPLDWLRPRARLAIVGITPGRDTMRIAYQTAVDGFATGRPVARVLDEVKLRASFSGFRTQLNEWLSGLPRCVYPAAASGPGLLEHRRAQVHGVATRSPQLRRRPQRHRV